MRTLMWLFGRQSGYVIGPLHTWRVPRVLILFLLERFGDRDWYIPHSWHPECRMRLHVFRHKGYWYHRKRREKGLMSNIPRLVRPGMRVVEIGGNIGWITVHLAKCVGRNGEVLVLEASPMNVNYLRDNTFGLSNVVVVEAAASNHVGEAEFFVETLTGQNDLLVQDYGVLQRNEALAFRRAEVKRIIVKTMPVDDLICPHRGPIEFVKVDVEGAELVVLEGMRGILSRDRPAVAIEITRNRKAVFAILEEMGYLVVDASLSYVESVDGTETNLIGLHREVHVEYIAGIVGLAGSDGRYS